MTPRRFCEQISVCGAAAAGGQAAALFRLINNNNQECELCRVASQVLAPYCTPEAAASVVDYLNASICQRYVSPDERANCSLLAKNATDAIFQLVVEGKLCAKLGVCPDAEKTVVKKSEVKSNLKEEVKSVPWMRFVESVDAAKVQATAKELVHDNDEGGNNIVINNINNNIMNVNNNVEGNTIVVNDHVKISSLPTPPPPPAGNADAAPAAAADAAADTDPPSVGNPAECSVCEYVGLALLLGQSPADACATAFASQPRSQVDACRAFVAPFAQAMKRATVANHVGVLNLCRSNKYC